MKKLALVVGLLTVGISSSLVYAMKKSNLPGAAITQGRIDVLNKKQVPAIRRDARNMAIDYEEKMRKGETINGADLNRDIALLRNLEIKLGQLRARNEAMVAVIEARRKLEGVKSKLGI